MPTQLNTAIISGDLEAVKKMLRSKANPNSVDASDGRTPLTNACRISHLEIIQILIQAGADVNRQNKNKDLWGNDISQVPLMAACDVDSENHESVNTISKLLIKHGANVSDAHPKDRDGAIHFAAKYGHVETVRTLLEHGVQVNTKGSNGYTALIYAAYKGKSIPLVKLLLKSGANPKKFDNAGDNPVFRLISGDEDNVEMMQLFIDAGSELTSKGYGDALYWAARCGKKKIVELLIGRGMDVNGVNYNGDENAVIGAMMHKHIDVVKLLLDHGADPNSTKIFEGSLLEQVVEYGDQELIKLILEKKTAVQKSETKLNSGALVKAAGKNGILSIVKLLVESGISVNEIGYKEETALMQAAGFGKIDIVKYLLEKNADPTARDVHGNTALLWAASTGQNEVVQLLLEHGAFLHEKNYLNWNALMQAVFEGHLSTAELLLKAGASTEEIDLEKGASVLFLAKHSGNKKLVELLESYGAKERVIRRRQSGEPYFMITDCDICTYLPSNAELRHDYAPEEIPGLEIIYCQSSVDYKAEDTVMIKRCLHCGTYYSHYHYIDTEDSIGGAGPVCSHHFSRCNLLSLHQRLLELDKKEEWAEAKTRYPEIIASMQKLNAEGVSFKPYIQTFVIESLTDFYIMNKDWNALKKNLLEHKSSLFVLEVIHRLMLIYGIEVDKESSSKTGVKDVMLQIKNNGCAMIAQYQSEIKNILAQFNDNKDSRVRKKYTEVIFAANAHNNLLI